MNLIKSLGSGVLGIAIFIIVCFLLIFFIKGGVGIAVWLTPFLIELNNITTLISLFVLIPLALIKKTRIISTYGLIIASFIFGLSLWMSGFLITYSYWGVLGILIGLFLAGVGVVPTAIIASLLNGRWDLIGVLIYTLFLTFGSRLLAVYIASRIDKENAKRQQEVYENPEILPELIESPTSNSDERDSIYPDVVEFIQDKKQVNAEVLKDKFDIGYARAARIMMHLEDDGYVETSKDENTISEDFQNDNDHTHKIGLMIVKTLDAFGVNTKVTEINKKKGGYEYCLEVALGSPVGEIVKHDRDIALAVASPTGKVRIQAPIPGRALVGIFVPSK